MAEKIIGQVAYELLASELAKLIGGKAAKVHTHTADEVSETTTKKFVSPTEKADWGGRVTQQQLQQAIQTFSSGLAWKGVHDTLEALTTAIPTPKEGDFVIVIKEPTYGSKNTLLIYEGAPSNKWQTVGELFVPGKATQTADGLMSKEDKKKLDGLHNYTLGVATTTNLGGVKATADNAVTIAEDGSIGIADIRTVQNGERDKWNKASTDAASALTKVTAAEPKLEAVIAESAKNKSDLTTLTGRVGTAESDITALKEKTQVMTTVEAQEIIDKYKAQA